MSLHGLGNQSKSTISSKGSKAAETKIARLELAELLAGNSWTLKDAEPLVRKVQKLEGDIQVRHLQAVSDARKVLTAEQLQQAHADGGAGNLESLFR